jgi:hypothetical protein
MHESKNVVAVKEMYDLARRANHKELRLRLTDDVTWHPAREGAWRPCTTVDEVVRTLLWRTGVNKLRPAGFLDLGDRVLLQVKGRSVSRLGAKGVFMPRLYQVVVLRGGKVASIQDYPNREDAHAAVGLTTS